MTDRGIFEKPVFFVKPLVAASPDCQSPAVHLAMVQVTGYISGFSLAFVAVAYGGRRAECALPSRVSPSPDIPSLCDLRLPRTKTLDRRVVG